MQRLGDTKLRVPKEPRSTMNDHNPYAPPRANVDYVSTARGAAPSPLWNPNAAACWSLLFFLALKPGDEGENAYGPDPHLKDQAA